MGQKSLPALHRIDSSMIWHSYIYDKNYKWLSYNLWFSYIQFYKILFFYDNFSFKTANNLNYVNYDSILIYKKKQYFKINKTYIRFSYYVDLYCVEFYTYILLINLFFKTNLLFYKNKNKNKSNTTKKILDFLDIN